MKSTFEATKYFLTRTARMSVLDRLAKHWCFWNSDLIPEHYLVDLIPEIQDRSFQLNANIQHHFELPYGERLVMAALVDYLKPGKIFEFGTYTGSTTALIADLNPNAIVYTLDLPDRLLRTYGVNPEVIGSWFAGKPQYAGRIHTLRGDSREFDFSPYYEECDLIFVDGSHKYEDVLSDSRNALRMLAPGGFILWDDYHPPCLPVAAALDDLAMEIPIKRIAQTRLALYGPNDLHADSGAEVRTS